MFAAVGKQTPAGHWLLYDGMSSRS